MTYEGESGELNLYQFTSQGAIFRQLLAIDANIFDADGTIAIGQWQPPNNGIRQEIRPGFVGYMDNILVWNMLIEPTLVQDTRQLSLHNIVPVLSAGWLLDEGEGVTSSDIKSNYVLSLPEKPWSAPQWVPSSVEGLPVGEIDILNYTFYDGNLEANSKSTCAKMLQEISKSVQGPSDAYLEMVNIMCLQQVTSRNILTDAFDVLFMVAETCEVEAELASWPGQALCDVATDKMKPAHKCSRLCQFGVEEEDGTCLCNSGYRSANCSTVCQGGSQKPCGLHGLCDEAGKCQCDTNWNGNSECTQCSANWVTTDCSVLIQSSSVTKWTAYVTPTALYRTFDQAYFSLPSIAGVFVLFKNSDTEIQVHQTLCEHGACITAVAFQKGTVTLAVYAGNDDENTPVLFSNGAKMEIDATYVDLGSGVTLQLHNIHAIQINVNTADGQLEILASIVGQFIHISLDSAEDLCNQASGVLGSCDADVSNDLLTDLTSGDGDDNSRQIQTTFKRAVSSSLFASQSGIITESLGYCLSFNNSAGRSVPMTYQFVPTGRRKRSVQESESDVTVSFLVKPVAAGGIIMSYGKMNTFAVENSKNITLHCGAQVIITKSQLHLNKWNQLVLAFERSKQILHLYSFAHDDTTLMYEKLSFNCPDFMETGGRITLGDWEPAPDGTQREVLEFYGEIDEFSVWLTYFPHTIIYQMYKLNVRPYMFKDYLVYLYKFAEGLGNTAHEIVKDRDIHLPQIPWPHPMWAASDIELSDLPHTNTPNDMTADDVKLACTEFFTDSTIKSTCYAPLSGDVYNLYFSLCGRNSNINGAFYTIITFVNVCQYTSGSTMDLESLCAEEYAPSWIQRYCHNCLFGHWTGERCQCLAGFLGVRCDKACPTGTNGPCNKRGICQPDGSCFCDLHYTGIACETFRCASGWIGSDCSILPASYSVPDRESAVGHVESPGRVISLDGTMYDITEFGTYQMLALNDVVMRIRLSECHKANEAYPCFQSAMLQHKEHYYFFNTSSVASTRIRVWVLENSYDVITELTVQGLHIRRENVNTLTITIDGSALSIIVYIDVYGLHVTVQMTHSDRALTRGVLGICDVSAAIRYQRCDNVDVCAENIDQAAVAACKVEISHSNLNSLLVQFSERNEIYDLFAGTELADSSTGICLYFDDSGIFKKNVALPSTSFTLELQVKPVNYGGVILSYTRSKCLLLILLESGLEVHYETRVIQTNLQLELNIWTQVSLFWDMDTYKLETYTVHANGNTYIYSIKLDSEAFATGGSLAIGEIAPGSSVKTSIEGAFIGYLDEIRVWSRPHNPSVVANTGQIAVSVNTPDLELWWDFNDGEGTIMAERVESEDMKAIAEHNPPTWVVSDLTLKKTDVLGYPGRSLTNVSLINDVCEKLLTDSEIERNCHFFGTAYLQAMKEACISSATTVDNQHPSEIVFVQLSIFCASLTSDSTVAIPPPDCDASICCRFGSLNNVTDRCDCQYGFWGDSCSRYCPSHLAEICYEHGTCQPQTGLCQCEARWLGAALQVTEYNSRASLTVVPDYPCSECTADWFGDDCSLTITNTSLIATSKYHVALLYRDLVSVLDGAHYVMILPGPYQLLLNSEISIQVLMLPCRGDSMCRSVADVSIKVGNDVYSVQKAERTLVIWHRKGSGDWEKIEWKAATMKTLKYDGVIIKWYLGTNARFLFNTDIEVLVSLINGELLFGVQAHSVLTGFTGILGNNNGLWTDDLDYTTAGNDLPNVLSTQYIGEHVKATFMIPASSNHLQHPSGRDNITSGGYMLRFSQSTVQFKETTQLIILDEFAYLMWFRVHQLVAADIQMLNLTFVERNVGLIIKPNGEIRIRWDNMEMVTGIVIEERAWMHLAITWHSSTGRLHLFTWTADGMSEFKEYNVDVGVYLVFDELVCGANNGGVLEIDYIRLFRYELPASEIEDLMYVYDSDQNEGLNLLIMFDEGTGSTCDATVLTPAHSITLKGKLITGTDLIWLPSNIPVFDQSTPHPLPAEPDDSVLAKCLNVTYNDLISNYCSNLGAVLQLFLEQCISQLLYEQEGVEGLTSAVLFYCRGVNDVDECDLDGYLDFCAEEEEFPIWLIILICIILLLLLIIIIVVTIVCLKKKKKKKESEYNQQMINDGDELLPDSTHNASTAPRDTKYHTNYQKQKTFDMEPPGKDVMATVPQQTDPESAIRAQRTQPEDLSQLLAEMKRRQSTMISMHHEDGASQPMADEDLIKFDVVGETSTDPVVPSKTDESGNRTNVPSQPKKNKPLKVGKKAKKILSMFGSTDPVPPTASKTVPGQAVDGSGKEYLNISPEEAMANLNKLLQEKPKETSFDWKKELELSFVAPENETITAPAPAQDAGKTANRTSEAHVGLATRVIASDINADLMRRKSSTAPGPSQTPITPETKTEKPSSPKKLAGSRALPPVQPSGSEAENGLVNFYPSAVLPSINKHDTTEKDSK
ncbi:hypothetical protein LSH36_273g03004 [Paralvinella palmiformis]|uniref:EGF-like domain-containing protein n=1 Tax=Paralvinella palmiformis TaxID=53620 RepID=A0AAD9JJB1_9ANNE|nr:hypothetical protein LSH36_273g03004 [Paralvinella palmiformis]